MENEKRILITGGSGLVGRRLTTLLEAEGYEVAWLSRGKKGDGRKIFQWDIDAGIMDSAALDWAGAIIHLAGEGIAEKKWTARRKEEILQSRVKPAFLLKKKMDERGGFSGRIICASAVGFYGAMNSTHLFSETDSAGQDFMAEVCQQWESASNGIIEKAHGKGCILRVGIVISANGGALPKLAGPVKYFAGARLGSGKQMIPWIHIDDVCRMFVHCLENQDCYGIYNACGPQSVSHDELMFCVSNIYKRPIILPHVPEFVLKVILGEMAVMVTRGVSVSSEKIIRTGFRFLYPELQDALRKELL